ncbi:MAG: hypothetical protein ACYTEX_18685, partial [Planctomycetota bacterium]
VLALPANESGDIADLLAFSLGQMCKALFHRVVLWPIMVVEQREKQICKGRRVGKGGDWSLGHSRW